MPHDLDNYDKHSRPLNQEEAERALAGITFDKLKQKFYHMVKSEIKYPGLEITTDNGVQLSGTFELEDSTIVRFYLKVT